MTAIIIMGAGISLLGGLWTAAIVSALQRIARALERIHTSQRNNRD